VRACVRAYVRACVVCTHARIHTDRCACWGFSTIPLGNVQGCVDLFQKEAVSIICQKTRPARLTVVWVEVLFYLVTDTRSKR